MSIRDIRLHWPKAEQALRREGEIIVTRDGTPIARLLPYEGASPEPRPSFDAADHLRWLATFWRGSTPSPTTDQWLREDRSE